MRKALAPVMALLLFCALVACGDPGEEITATVAATTTTTTATTVAATTITTTETATEAIIETNIETTTEPGITTKAVDALQLFNEATKKVKELKPGYKKSRYSRITRLDFSALVNISLVRNAVAGFLGVDGKTLDGIENYTVNKGENSHHMRASTWTRNDIKSASAELDGKGGYAVTILVKDGTTRWGGEGGDDPGTGTLNSPVDRGPLCYGRDDSEDYDHKTALNLYYTINHADNALTRDIGETVSGIKVVADIDSEGRLTKLYGRMDMTVNVYHVRYTIITLTNKSGSGYGTVEYTDFKY